MADDVSDGIEINDSKLDGLDFNINIGESSTSMDKKAGQTSSNSRMTTASSMVGSPTKAGAERDSESGVKVDIGIF